MRLQGDNCSKENKNVWLLGYLAILVYRRIFNSLELHMLMAGHTHTEIDAMFSFLSVALDKMSAFTFSSFVNAFLPAAYKSHANKPTVETVRTIFAAPQLSPFTQMPVVYDFKAWIDPNLRDMSGHSNYRSFR